MKHTKEINIKTKYEVSDEILKQLPKEFIELINGIPFDSELFKRRLFTESEQKETCNYQKEIIL